MEKAYRLQRVEPRMPLEVGVQITGNAGVPGTEATFTENVSPSGARILTARPWRVCDRLEIAASPGSFRAKGRVAYCQTLRGEGFAIGIKFLEQAGQWIVTPAAPEVSRND